MSHPPLKDYIGKQFSSLTVLGYAGKRAGLHYWHCRCDCGNEVDVTADNLLTGLTKSCGCMNHEQRQKFDERLHFTENTCVERLIRAQKTGSENKTGFRGVSLTEKGKYRVTITFQKVQYHIGYFYSFETAKKARLDAEESFHAGFVSAYSRWQERAEADPDWAEKDPFFCKVQRVNRYFQVMTNAPDYQSAGALLPLQEG